MKKEINQVLEIIKTYRQDEQGVNINEKHIETWINQFEENDRSFILSELAHILPECYISKDMAIEVLNSTFEVLAKKMKFDSIDVLLDHTCFLHCQAEHKSQTVLLNILDEVIMEKYGRTVNDCGSKEIKFWIYLDDVIASGGTFRREIIQEIKNYGVPEFESSGISIISFFFILHNWGWSNSTYAIEKEIGYKLGEKRLIDFKVSRIENNPRINYYNPSPKFNHVYPIKSEAGEKHLQCIEDSFERTHKMSNEEFAFRNVDFPKKEEFYSSSDNRNRYESILLNKGIEIINQIKKINAKGLRPLGMTSPSYKTLGTGSHTFTWRNISNTCPLVFWWETNDWYPLFPVKNRG